MHLSRLPSRIESRTCDCPYLTPWQVRHREPGGGVTLQNVGTERLTFVRLALAGTGSLALSLPRHANPGERIQISCSEEHPPGADTVVVVRWFRPDGREYLWLVSC